MKKNDWQRDGAIWRLAYSVKWSRNGLWYDNRDKDGSVVEYVFAINKVTLPEDLNHLVALEIMCIKLHIMLGWV